MSKYLERVVQLCDDYVQNNDPKMKWMWGEGLLGYALILLDQYRKDDRYQGFLTKFSDYYLLHEPKIDHADRFAPILITYMLDKIKGTNKYQPLLEKGLDYLFNFPRLIEDAVNHLGYAFVSKFYPKSIWVDSLMMFGVFPALYGKNENDQKALEIAARQPAMYAKYLQDPNLKLWYHSYWVKSKTHYPKRPLFWGRGNGWVLASFPMILDQLGEVPEKDEIITILQETAKAVLDCQNKDGSFSTLLTQKSYTEASATLLIAAGFLHGVHQGYLDKSYLEPGRRAFLNAVGTIKTNRKGRLVLPDISAPTIPLPIFPKLGYTLTPKGSNWSYGLAALIFAAIQYDRCRNLD